MCSINKKIKIKTTTHKIDITNAEIPLTVIYQVVSSPMVSTQGKKYCRPSTICLVILTQLFYIAKRSNNKKTFYIKKDFCFCFS